MSGVGDVHLDPANAEQSRAWNEDEGRYWAANASHFDRGVAVHHVRLMAAASIAPDERVLDIGCGTGQTTRDAARAAHAGHALGIDLSSPMLDYARGRAAEDGLENVEFEQGDAQVHPFEPMAFDLAMSRTGTMFFADPVAAFTNIRRALQPSGRMVLLTWQPLSENEWMRAFFGALAAGRDLPAPPPGAPGPFALANPDRVRAVLGAAGFADVELDGAHADMWFGVDADDASRLVLGLMGWMLEGLDDAARTGAVDALHATMVDHETDDGVRLDSATWTIRARPV